MKKIIINEETELTIGFDKVDQDKPIFAKHAGELCGMIVHDPQGWILRVGGASGATGHHETLKECINSCLELTYGSYTFHVAD